MSRAQPESARRRIITLEGRLVAVGFVGLVLSADRIDRVASRDAAEVVARVREESVGERAPRKAADEEDAPAIGGMTGGGGCDDRGEEQPELQGSATNWPRKARADGVSSR